MTTQYTPGPWALSRSGTMVRTVVQQRASFDLVIAELREPDHGSVEANARLIVAAPEMLEAIEHLVESLVAWQHQYDPDGTDDVTAGRIHAANALLDKIEGKEETHAHRNR